jgi:hypothetical protein
MKSPFLQIIEERMYLKRYAKSTIKAYIGWISAFIRFHSMRHPSGNLLQTYFATHDTYRQSRYLNMYKPLSLE